MATKTFEELKQLAIQIRDEKTNKQNTATRVGTAMLEHINKLEQDYYDKTQTDEELKERDDKLTELEVELYVIDKSVVLRSNTGKFIDFSRNDDGVIVTLFANYIFGQYFNYNIPSELSANVKVGGDYCVVYDKVNENLKIINYLEAKTENPLNVLIARFIYDGSRIIILYVASVLYTVDGISCDLLDNSKNIDIFSKKIDKVILQNRFNSINITTGNPNVLHVKDVSIKTIRDGAIFMLPDQEVELTNSTFNFILLNITDGNIISTINQSDAEQYINSSGYYLIGTIYPIGNSEQGVYQLDCDFSINGIPYLLTSDESANKYDHLDSYSEKNFLVAGGNDYIYNQMFESGTIKNIRIKVQTSGQLILDIWRKIDDYMFEKINTLPAYNVQEGDNTIRVNISVSEPFYIGYNNSSTVLPLSVEQDVHTTRGLFYRNKSATENFTFSHNNYCGIEIDVITEHPKNRRISYKQLDHIGDSITDFCDSIYPSFGYQLIGYDNYLAQKVDFKKKIKINGYAGYTVGKIDGQGSIQDKLAELIVSDIYTTLLGTNDFNFGVELGTIDDYKNKTNSNTFYGGYRVLIDYLYSLNVSIQ